MSGVKYSKVKYFLSFIISLCFYGIVASIPVSASSVEIKMDLSYKYKKDDFKVIYTDDNNNEYDVTRKSELNIEEIDTGSGIVRKATANYDGLSDVVYENTYFFEGSSTFQSAFDNMRLVNTYLMSISNKTIVLDILNVKIKKDTYHEGNTVLNYGWTPRHNIHVAREVNYIGCNSDNSDYDMPIFDGQDQTHELAIVTANDSEHIYNDRTINFYNIQIQNYENVITLQHQYNSTIKGLVFKDMGDKPFNDNDEICERDIGKCRAEAIIGLDYINNVTVRDTEFRDAYGSSSYFHAIYLSHNVDGAIITNDFFLNTGIDVITMRDNVTNTNISENYLFNVGAVNSDRSYNMCFVSINQSKPTSSKPGEKDSKGNSFCGNWIRNEATDRGHPAITIRPDGGYTNRFYAFENSECSNSGNYGDTLSCKIPECSDDTTKCKLKDYYYPAEWDIEIPDMEPWLKVNSCEKGNTSEISSEEFTPTRNIIKHIDKSGNTLSPNDVIIVNGGESFTISPRKNFVGISGDDIYTKEYSVRLYDENNNLITTDINGNRISDENGYINNYTEISLNSLLKNNQTLQFVYANPEELPESEEILIPKVPDAGRLTSLSLGGL